MKSRLIKGGLTVLGAIAFSTLGIFASDALRGIDSGIENFAGARKAGICTEGSIPLKRENGIICVDMYEASPGEKCPHPEPRSAVDSERNASATGCYAASVEEATPWAFVSLPQAQRMCAGAGKRLPTSDEWYDFALGTIPENCVIREDSLEKTGEKECISSLGVYDTIGNVWEWVDETVIDGSYDGRTLPPEGYVTSVDSHGVAITSGENADELYGKDYIWSKREGVLGMIRGGFYGSTDDAGLYTVNAAIPTSFVTQGIGFRCVEDVL